MMQGPFIYIGDVDLAQGGLFIGLPSFPASDYAHAVKITDLDSGCGFTDATMIESGVIFIGQPGDAATWARLDAALPVVGAAALWPARLGQHWPDIDDNGTIRKAGTRAHWMTLACAVDAYQGLDGPSVEIISTNPESPDSWEGWTLDERTSESVADFTESRYCVSIDSAVACDDSPACPESVA